MTKILSNTEISHNNKIVFQAKQDEKNYKNIIPKEKKDFFDKTENDKENDFDTLVSNTDTKSKKVQNVLFYSMLCGGGLGYFFTKNKNALVKFFTTTITAMISGVLGLALFFKPTENKANEYNTKR